MTRVRSPLLLIIALGATALGCTPVKPWEKEHLADPQMRFDIEPAYAKIRRHLYESKEGSFGGYGIGSGGCGCN